jgi:hypothetical protein
LSRRAGRAGTRHWTRLRFSEPQGASTLRLLRCSRVSAGRSQWWARGFLPPLLYAAISEFDHLIEYHQRQNSFIDSEGKRFTEELEEYVQKNQLKGEVEWAYYETHEEELHMLHSFFPIALRYSIFVLMCTLFESKLTEICKELERSITGKTTITWSSPSRDKGVNRAEKFLRRKYDIHLMEHLCWENIIDYFKLRHCITHVNGAIGLMKVPDEIRKIVQKDTSRGLEETEDNRLALDQTFVRSAISNMHTFCVALQDAFIDNKYVGPVFWP